MVAQSMVTLTSAAHSRGWVNRWPGGHRREIVHHDHTADPQPNRRLQRRLLTLTVATVEEQRQIVRGHLRQGQSYAPEYFPAGGWVPRW
jgi:hypothetical protein